MYQGFKVVAGFLKHVGLCIKVLRLYRVFKACGLMYQGFKVVEGF